MPVTEFKKIPYSPEYAPMGALNSWATNSNGCLHGEAFVGIAHTPVYT